LQVPGNVNFLKTQGPAPSFVQSCVTVDLVTFNSTCKSVPKPVFYTMRVTGATMIDGWALAVSKPWLAGWAAGWPPLILPALINSTL